MKIDYYTCLECMHEGTDAAEVNEEGELACVACESNNIVEEVVEAEDDFEYEDRSNVIPFPRMP